MLIKKLEAEYGRNNPIFLEEIFNILPEYSEQSIYRLISNAIKAKELIKFDKGVYFLPKQTEFGIATPSVERVVAKKYIRNGNEVFGIYGKWVIELNFDLSTQVPNTIEIITNNASRAVRELEIKGRRVILRKSRLPITKENASAYTLLELFNGLDLREYREPVRNRVKEYVKKEMVTRKDIMDIAYAFPAKAMQNMALSGVLYEVI